MVEVDHPELSIQKQCQLLHLNRSSYYYQAQEISQEDKELLRLIDQQYLETPFYGSRKITALLQQKGYTISRKKVQRLMRQLGLEVIYPKPKLSRKHPEHIIYPYLLKGVKLEAANQVWSTDITYLPVYKGHLYLVAMMDWYSRRVLSWRISNTMDVEFCVEALEEAKEVFGKPEIFNSDQGSQFTSERFTNCLKSEGIRISMDGRGRCHDNIFIERLWRSLKYELIYIQEFEDVKHLKMEVKKWFRWYNDERIHQALGYRTPKQVYCESLKLSEGV